MRLSKNTETDELIERMSKLKGPNRAEQGAMLWMGAAFAKQDVDLRRRSARIARQTQMSLRRAFPDVDPQLIGDVVADLNSLWDVAQKLDKELKKLFHMRFPQHYNHLGEFLSFIEATQIDMVEFWIGNLRRRIPKLRKALDRRQRTMQSKGSRQAD